MLAIDLKYVRKWLGEFNEFISDDELIQLINNYNKNLKLSPIDHYEILMVLYESEIDENLKCIFNVLILKVLNRFKIIWTIDEICDGYTNLIQRKIEIINIQNFNKEEIVLNVFQELKNTNLNEINRNSLFFGLIVLLNDEIYG